MITAEYLNNFFLGYLPYVALTVLATGLIYRTIRRNNTIQASSSQFISNDKSLRWGSTLFHYAILLVLLGHILGLLTPEWLYNWFMTNEIKRLLAILMGSISGAAALVGITLLVVRRFSNKRVWATSKIQDYVIVVLLLVQISLGLWCTYITTQSSLEDYMAMEYWAQGIFIFEPDSWKYIADADLIYKLHIVNGFLIFIIFPFTKLMHMIMVPVLYAIDHFRK
jgi:nitrate reductase gamma subunit